MSLIQWRDEYSVGVAAVDHEHQELIATINELHDAMRTAVDHDHVVDALGKIYAQISAHFALEEKIMRDARYSAYPEHKLDHETLLDELRDIMDSVDDQGNYDEAGLSQDLDRWFSDHFRTHDARLHKLLG